MWGVSVAEIDPRSTLFLERVVERTNTCQSRPEQIHLTNKEATDQSKRDEISRSAMDALAAQAQELQMGYECLDS